jgi:hypothetical protein
MFYALATNQSYFEDKISVFIALGPVLELSHCQSGLLDFVAAHDTLLVDAARLLGIYDFFPANWLTTGAFRLLCGTLPSICKFGTYLIADEDTSLDDSDRLTVYMGHFPSGTSLNSLVHYGQILQAGKFQKYDYGKEANMKIYGQATPPLIPIKSITKVPMALFVGKDDELADTEDAEWADNEMVKSIIFYHEYVLGHLSFMVAKEMSYFTVDAMAIINKYHPASITTFLA